MRALTFATGSSWVWSITTSAPMVFAISSRLWLESTAITRPAPRRRAPAVAHRPMGAWANTTTESPSWTLAVSTAEMPVVAMSVTNRTSSSESPSGILARLPARTAP